MQPCELKHEVAGFFRFEKFKTDTDGNEIEGTREVAADWFPNLILDQGLNLLATSQQYLDACQVGSGSTTPANGQTGLVSRIAGTTTRLSPTVSRAAEAPYYVAYSLTYRYAEGVAAGNIAEVGVGTAATGSTLFSRSLVKDSLGNPTTITILSDESLDVIYQLRYYAPAADVTGTVVATGNIGGSYDYILRASNVTTGVNADLFGWSLPVSQDVSVLNSNSFQAYNGAIGGVTGSPSGTTAALSSISKGTYANGTFYLDRVVTGAAGVANLAGGLRSMRLKLGIGTYQIEFDPPIPKTSNDVVQLTIRLSWGRRP